ncbi:hypothetical protein ACLHDF_08425 [Priestia aryabhattai]|uniref:hypothetical protein n=1 Tax=Priestia megaterium TaxID=1404 RepID=UPI0039B94B76
MRVKNYFFIFPLVLLVLASCDPSSTPKEKYCSSTKSTNLELSLDDKGKVEGILVQKING